MATNIVACVLGLLVLANALQFPRHATRISRELVSDTEYDFIVVGGVSVLVIEAGPFDNGEEGVAIPGASDPAAYIWQPLTSQPQTALHNRTFLATCARVVGGGSVVNAMVFLRGGKPEYAAWEGLGAKGWDWDGLLPYFKKSENLTLPSGEFAAEANISWVESAHGNQGPVQASYPNYYFPGSANWWNAALSAGITPTDDPNGGSAKGLFWFPTAVDARSRTRSSARINHYERVKASRENYHILAENTAARVLFDDKKAIGVEYLPTNGGDTLTVYASKEVILAAGAIHTTQVLQLSGIGPRKLLDDLGIRIISELPGVGANFQDHPSLSIPYNFANNVVPNAGTLETNATYDAEQRDLYITAKEGAYTIVRGLSTTLANPPLRNTTSDWKAIVSSARVTDPTTHLPSDTHHSVKEGYRAQRKLILSQLEGPDVPVGLIHWTTGNSATITFLKPLSRGTITINSTNPLAQPLVDFRTATDPVDLDLFIALFGKNREIMATPDMQVLGPREAAPFGENVTSTEQLKDIFAARMGVTGGHECCTAAMMPRDMGGVVDPRMKVYGVRGLRVVDTSFWPMLLTAPPLATTYAVGEKVGTRFLVLVTKTDWSHRLLMV
ncbi:GMC-OxRdtase-N domain-containing protein [Fusarium keratoplasticum]|nr:GMC-OxRdtase-N domain-containing protein [Fusarium keratoplasticum]